MQKIIIQGPKVSDLTDVNNSPMILEEEKILEHFQKSHSANEIFINSHGNPVTKKQLRADLATSDNMSEKDKETYLLKCFNQSYNPNYTDLLEHPPAHLSVDLFENSLCLINPLLSRIIKNTEGSSPNIVHIFSCHSGAAQHYAHKIDGKFILCTYTSAENTMDMPAAPTLFDKYNQSDNLLDFIIKNLTLVSVMGFSVFYKSDDAAYCLAFNPKDIKTMNSAGIKEFMQAQYKKIAEFQHFDQKHLKIFPEYKLPNIEEYTDNEVKDIITNILNFSITDLTFSQIQDLLKIEGLDIYHALRRVICSKDQEVLELSLRYPNINMKIDNALIGTAIKKADLNTVKRIIKEVTSIGKLIFEDAIDSGKLEIIKVVAEKAAMSCIDLVFDADNLNSSDKLEVMKAIFKNIPELHESSFYDIFRPSKLDKPHLLEIIKVVLSKTTHISHDVLQEVGKTNDSELINIVKSYMDNPVKLVETIEPTNLIAENNHEVTTVGEVYSEE